jgi:hypothetical protein
MSMLFPHLGPSTPTFRCTCCARRHRSSSSTSVRERLASANALAISGKRCEPGFPDAEPVYTYTAPPRIFFRLTILVQLLAKRCYMLPARLPALPWPLGQSCFLGPASSDAHQTMAVCERVHCVAGLTGCPANAYASGLLGCVHGDNEIEAGCSGLTTDPRTQRRRWLFEPSFM